MMKAITLTQPWATALAVGIKHFETRAWYTQYRGPLAIHAGKAWSAEDRKLAAQHETILGVSSWRNLPRGCVIATANLVDVTSTNRLFHGHPDWREIEAELAWGDFSPRRFYWRLADVVRLPEPIPARGKLGLWEWEG